MPVFNISCCACLLFISFHLFSFFAYFCCSLSSLFIILLWSPDIYDTWDLYDTWDRLRYLSPLTINPWMEHSLSNANVRYILTLNALVAPLVFTVWKSFIIITSFLSTLHQAPETRIWNNEVWERMRIIAEWVRLSEEPRGAVTFCAVWT